MNIFIFSAALFYSLANMLDYNSQLKMLFQFGSLSFICFFLLKNKLNCIKYTFLQLFFAFLAVIGFIAFKGDVFKPVTLINFIIPFIIAGLAISEDKEKQIIKGLVMPYFFVLPIIFLQYLKIDFAWDIRALIPTPGGSPIALNQMYGNRPFGLSYYSITLSYQLALLLPLMIRSFYGRLFISVITGTKSLMLGVGLYKLFELHKRHRFNPIDIILKLLLVIAAAIIAYDILVLVWDSLGREHQKSFTIRIAILDVYFGTDFMGILPDFLQHHGKVDTENYAPHNYLITTFFDNAISGIIAIWLLLITFTKISFLNPYFPVVFISYINSMFHNGGLVSGLHLVLLLTLLAFRKELELK